MSKKSINSLSLGTFSLPFMSVEWKLRLDGLKLDRDLVGISFKFACFVFNSVGKFRIVSKQRDVSELTGSNFRSQFKTNKNQAFTYTESNVAPNVNFLLSFFVFCYGLVIHIVQSIKKSHFYTEFTLFLHLNRHFHEIFSAGLNRNGNFGRSWRVMQMRWTLHLRLVNLRKLSFRKKWDAGLGRFECFLRMNWKRKLSDGYTADCEKKMLREHKQLV